MPAAREDVDAAHSLLSQLVPIIHKPPLPDSLETAFSTLSETAALLFRCLPGRGIALDGTALEITT